MLATKAVGPRMNVFVHLPQLPKTNWNSSIPQISCPFEFPARIWTLSECLKICTIEEDAKYFKINSKLITSFVKNAYDNEEI